MGDDWDDQDWESDSFTPQLPGTSKPSGLSGSYETVGQAVLARASEPDASKFAGEDEGEDEPTPLSVPQSQPSKKPPKKTYEDKGSTPADQPLDDPVAEKLRLQRLVEESDFKAAQELFGGGSTVDLDTFSPKSAKDFEELGRNVAAKYLGPHAAGPHYKSALKALIKAAVAPLTLQEVRDLDACIAGVKADKLKEETASKAAKKLAGKKKTLNVGKSGGSAGLDDYKFEDPLDDEYDFM